MTTPMMLDGADGPAPFGRWENEDSNDALPYADVLPEGWRAGVDQLVQEEMRRMKKRPKDYLAEMVPAREIDWRGCPLLRKEFERVEKGGGRMPPPDAARYELAPPPKSKRGDEDAWEAAVRNARAPRTPDSAHSKPRARREVRAGRLAHEQRLSRGSCQHV